MRGLQVAIIGCGRMGKQRASSACRWGAKIVAVYDADESRAAQLAAELNNCQAVKEPAELPWDYLDAVFICSPPFARPVVELMAIDAGVPFLVEKPLGLSANHCLPVVEELQQHKLITAAGYMNRYRESVQRAKEVLKGETLLGLSANWFGGRYKVPWWQPINQSGGPVNEQMTHLVDLARFLGGDIIAVQSVAGSPEPSRAERVSCSLVFESGALGSLLYSCEAGEKMIGLRAYTANREVILDGWDFQLTADGTGEPLPEPDANREDIFHRETAQFLTAVRWADTEAMLCDYADAWQTQLTVDAIRKSLLSGRQEPVQALEKPSLSTQAVSLCS